MAIATPLFLFLIIIVTFQLLPVPNGKIYARTALVELADMTPPLLAHSRLRGKINEQRRIPLSLGLRPQNTATLHQYAQDITRVSSPNYHHFLTPTEYNATYSPTETTYDTLGLFLRNAGFTITHTYPHHLLLDFSGTVVQVEQAFHVTLHEYIGPDNHIYYSNDHNPLLPIQFAQYIIAINGLNNAFHWHPTMLSTHRAAGQQRLPSSRHLCPAYNHDYLLPDQFAAAYDFNRLYLAHNQGEGQTIALFELSPFIESDITAYTACFGKSHTTIQAIPIGHNLALSDGALEVEMDAELILSAAPHLQTLKIYETSNDITSYLSQWARIIQDAPPVVSTSWGLCEQILDAATIKQENTLFMAAAMQGQTIFASTGDSGSAGCVGGMTDAPGGPVVDDPASQPYVTSVGGTSLLLKGLSLYDNEIAWNTTKEPPKGYNGASGGGISRYWVRPGWQDMTGVHNSYSTGKVCGAPAKKICRETPDISLHANADRGYIIYCSAQATKSCSNSQPWNVVGGTSASTPLWAALMALTNEMALKQKGHSVGFINPLLYQIARNPRQYAACFHDITSGNNDYNGQNSGRYPTSKGYDMATGLGSYDAYMLAQALVTLTKPSKVSAPPSSRLRRWHVLR